MKQLQLMTPHLNADRFSIFYI